MNELLRGVAIALGTAPLVNCPTFDANDDGMVAIAELVTAVQIALSGCPATPTPIPTPVAGCAAAPLDFGQGFVDFTTEIESSLVPIVQFENTPPTTSMAFFSDVDGDGIMEVLVAQNAPAQVALLKYDRDTEKLVRDFAIQLPAFDAFYGVADLDGDGTPDLIGWDRGPSVAWGINGGSFQPPTSLFPRNDFQAPYKSAYVDDLDGDGWLDILVATADPCGSPGSVVKVAFAQGGRHWTVRDDLIPTPLHIGDGLVFTAPLVGVPQTAIILGGDCDSPNVVAPRFFRPSVNDADRLPMWSPSDVITPHFGTAMLPDPLAAPMGAAVGDLDGDGLFELAISGNPVLGMWRGAANAPMPDVTDQTKMTTKIGDNGVELIPWSVLFVDLDRDGRLDAFVTHGDDYLAQETRHIGKQWSTVYWNAGGLCFEEISDALNVTRRGDWRTLAVGDLEGDGLPDLAVGGQGEQPRILHNRIDTGNNGLGLRLRGTTSNSYGIGALVDVTVSARQPVQRHLVGGFYPVSTVVEPLVFVGLGTATAAAEVRIAWPSGTVQELHDIAAGALHVISEPPVITIEPTTRHLSAASSEVAVIHVTPRDPEGAVRTDANIDVAVVTGAATLQTPPAWTGSEWRAEIAAPPMPGSSVIQVTVDGVPLGVRPRIWFD